MRHTHLHLLEQYLRAQPRIQMLNSVLPVGVSAETIANYEATLGYTLHEDIKAFYMAHNGAVIRWIDRDKAHFDPSLHTENNDLISMWIMINEIMEENPHAPTGVIDVAQFEGVFTLDMEKMDMSNDDFCYFDAMYEIDWDRTGWDQPWVFRGKKYATKEAFIRRLRILDLPNRDEEVVMLLLEDGNFDPPVFLTVDFEPHEGSQTISLSTYLTRLSAERNISLSRNQLFR